MTQQRPPAPTNSIGFWVCVSLVVGNMIGSGIFLLPSSLGAYGPISLWGWVLTGTGSIILALLFAKLAVQSHRPGGPFAYAEEGFGPFAGFLVAWGHWIAAWTGNAAIAVALTSYLTVFFPVLADNKAVAAASTLGVLWLLYMVNMRGIKAVGTVQLITTVVKLAPLAAFALLGVFYVELDNYGQANVSDLGTLEAVLATAALTLWAFLGLESATVPAGNVREPEKTIPRATIVGTAFVAVIYLVVSAVIFGILSPAELAVSNAPFADAAREIWGDWAFYMMALGAAVACLGALNGWMLIQAEVPLAAARRGLFPSIFARLDAQDRPLAGMTISTILVSVLILMNFSGDLVALFTFIILLATMSSLVPYLFCSMATLMIAARRGELREVKPARQLVITVLGFAYVIGAVLGAGQDVVFWGALLMFGSLPVYVWATLEQRAEKSGEAGYLNNEDPAVDTIQ